MSLARIHPEVDLFASPHNKQLSKFCSWTPCEQAMHVDNFTLDWCDIKGFLFAPFSCISSVLKKCVDDKIQHMCGIFPLWPTKSWWPTLMRLSNRQYSLLNGAGRRLSLPWDRSQKHPMEKRLKLIFGNLSMACWSAEMSHQTRPSTLQKMHGETKPSSIKRGFSKDDSNSRKKHKF